MKPFRREVEDTSPRIEAPVTHWRHGDRMTQSESHVRLKNRVRNTGDTGGDEGRSVASEEFGNSQCDNLTPVSQGLVNAFLWIWRTSLW
jgi:hypothetical protein